MFSDHAHTWARGDLTYSNRRLYVAAAELVAAGCSR